MTETPAPTGPAGYVTIAGLAERWGVAQSTIRTALRPGGWMPQPDAKAGRTLLWLEATVADVVRRPVGRPRRSTAPAASSRTTVTAPVVPAPVDGWWSEG